jgi:hypothetical protein
MLDSSLNYIRDLNERAHRQASAPHRDRRADFVDGDCCVERLGVRRIAGASPCADIHRTLQ